MAGKKDSGTEETCEIKNVSKPDKKKVESGNRLKAGGEGWNYSRRWNYQSGFKMKSNNA